MFPLLAPPRIVRKVNCFKVEQHFFSEGIVYGANDDDGVFGRLQNEEHTYCILFILVASAILGSKDKSKSVTIQGNRQSILISQNENVMSVFSSIT